MSFKKEVSQLRRKSLIRDMIKHQTEPPEHSPYGANLRQIVDGVLCTSERRKLMRLWFMQLAPSGYGGFVRLPVNRKWQYQTSDPDLTHLLSVGYIKLGRWNKGKGKRSGCYNSYLTLNREVE